MNASDLTTDEAGWNVRTAEPGDTIMVAHPPDDYESKMGVIDKTETEWVVSLLARPVEAPEGSNPCLIQTVRMQTTAGRVERDEPGAWNSPSMQVVQATHVGEPKWVRVWESDEP